MLNKKTTNLFQYGIVIALSVFFTILCFRLWVVELSEPIFYGGDYIFTTATVKGMIDGGSFYQDPNLGAPFGGEYYDYPDSDTLHILVIGLFAKIFHNASLAVNLYYLLCFPLTAVLSYFVIRQFKLPFLLALIGAMAYAFIPYHFLRIPHIFLAAYYMLPLSLWLSISIFSGDLKLTTYPIKIKQVFRSKTFWIALILCLLIGSSGVYYAIFSLVIMLFLLLLALFEKKPFNSISLLVLICFVAGAVVINLLPFAIFQWRNGPTLFPITSRVAAETEVYGLKIVQMLLPSPWHHIGRLALITARYDAAAPLVNENYTSSLGAVGAMGFIFGIFILVFQLFRKSVVHLLSAINAVCLLVGQIGGFGSVIAYLGFTQIRAYNRISIVIGFLSILLTCFGLQYLSDWIANHRLSQGRKFVRYIITSAQIIFLCLVLFDEYCVPNTTQFGNDLANDHNYVKRIESILPPGSMIFQLPYQAFPEGGPVNNMVAYDPLKLYVQSTTLKWSSGAEKGRTNGEWYKTKAALPPNELLTSVVTAGFTGLSIDRFGYVDGDKNNVEVELTQLIGHAPITSTNQRYAFFDLREYEAKIHRQFDVIQWNNEGLKALYPIDLIFKDEFSPLESNGKINWRWSGNKNILEILKPVQRKPVKLDIEFDVITASGLDSELAIESSTWNEVIKISAKPTHVSHILLVDKNVLEITFKSNAPVMIPGNGDFRKLIFRIDNFSFSEL